MTTASQGLAAALGRSANGALVALAEMSVDDLVASLSDEQKAGLAANLPTIASASDEMPPKKKVGCSDDEDEDDADGDSDPEEMPMKPAKTADERVAAVAAAVESDPACQGKAALALSMLADEDFAGLSASGIIKLLGKSPATVSAAADTTANADEAAREEMRAAINSTGNSNIEAAGGATPTTAANATAVWDRVIAKMPGSGAN